MIVSQNYVMRGKLFIITCGATVAVGALSLVTATAYAAPIPTSSFAVLHSVALVVPLNYHPADFGSDAPIRSKDGVVTVTPHTAVDIARPNSSSAEGLKSDDAASPPTSGGGASGSENDVTPATPPASNGSDSSGSDSSGSTSSGSDSSGSTSSGNDSALNIGPDANNTVVRIFSVQLLLIKII